MPRDYRVSLEDILGSLERIRVPTSGLTYQEFGDNFTGWQAMIRNLGVIGEAAKSVDHETRSGHPEVERTKIAGLRDVLIHHYFGIDLEIIWDIIQTKLSNLDAQIKKIP